MLLPRQDALFASLFNAEIGQMMLYRPLTFGDSGKAKSWRLESEAGGRITCPASGDGACACRATAPVGIARQPDRGFLWSQAAPPARTAERWGIKATGTRAASQHKMKRAWSNCAGTAVQL